MNSKAKCATTMTGITASNNMQASKNCLSYNTVPIYNVNVYINEHNLSYYKRLKINIFRFTSLKLKLK